MVDGKTNNVPDNAGSPSRRNVSRKGQGARKHDSERSAYSPGAAFFHMSKKLRAAHSTYVACLAALRGNTGETEEQRSDIRAMFLSDVITILDTQLVGYPNCWNDHQRLLLVEDLKKALASVPTSGAFSDALRRLIELHSPAAHTAPVASADPVAEFEFSLRKKAAIDNAAALAQWFADQQDQA